MKAKLFVFLLVLNCTCNLTIKENSEVIVTNISDKPDTNELIVAILNDTLSIINDDHLFLILDDKLEVYIPVDFIRVTEYELIRRYDNKDQRPTIIFEKAEKNVKLSINYGASRVLLNQLSEIKLNFEQLYKNNNIEIVSSEIRNINNYPFILMKIIIPNESIDQIYNYFFITSLDEKLLIGSFSFPENDHKKWSSVGDKIINSMKFNNRIN